jgi:hypothetical protein
VRRRAVDRLPHADNLLEQRTQRRERTFGIRAVSPVHERIALWHCPDFALGCALSPVVAGLGFGQHFTRPDRQTIRDRPAQTNAVRLPCKVLDAT